MHVVIDTSVSDWLLHVSPRLLCAEAENNLLLGLAAEAAEPSESLGSDGTFVRIMDGDAIHGAAMINGHNLILARQSSESLGALADSLATSTVSFPGVLGPDDAPAEFVEAWTARTGAIATRRQSQRIHECRAVAELRPAPGRCRAPIDSEVAVLAAWRNAFHVAVNATVVDDDHAAAVRRMMAKDRIVVWDHAREIVSCAATVRRTPNGAVIAFVYTPAEQRGHGYATSCVAELTRRNLAAGAEFCCLYTDLANPVSNAIYARIGYRRVCDSAWWQIGQQPN